MAAPARGLTPADLTALREALAAGKKPKVVFTSSAGQMAGNAGVVVELTDPASSDEWIVVQFGRDQLPFSPADLAIPVRGAAAAAQRPAKRTEAKAPAARKAAASAEPPGPPLLPPVPPPGKEAPTPRKEAAVTAPEPTRTGTVNGTMTGTMNGNGAVAKKVAKPKPPASLVVTLSYADQQWTVSAVQGSRALAKPYAIKPTEALRMVALIDVPGVHDAVEHIIASERADAEHRAVRLREELAEIESRLAELTARS
jgi:hypothetical protein